VREIDSVVSADIDGENVDGNGKHNMFDGVLGNRLGSVVLQLYCRIAEV
jgi:hypothetical protein